MLHTEKGIFSKHTLLCQIFVYLVRILAALILLNCARMNKADISHFNINFVQSCSNFAQFSKIEKKKVAKI